MAWNRIGNFAALSLAFIFAACGGDSGSNGKTETDESSQAETFDDLPNCSKNREGETIAVLDDRKTYVCTNGRWEYLNEVPDTVKTEDDLSACLEKNEGKIAFVTKNSTVWGCFDKRWEELGTAYENADALPNCSDKREGNRAYVVDDKESLICSDGKWENSSSQSQNHGGNSNDGQKSSSSNKESSSSSVEKSSNESSSSDSSESSSKESSSSVDEKSISSAEQSSSSAESTIVYGALTDERDGQKYKTVKIGEQTWMAENLNFDYKIDGKRYGSYCYNDEPDSCAIYGRLYTWATAMDSAALFSDDAKGCGDSTACEVVRVQGVCPENWHLPSQGEWEVLFRKIDGDDMSKQRLSVDGSSIKSKDKWRNNGVGTDVYGFSALPGGCLWCGKGWSGVPGSDMYSGEGGITYFWTANSEIGDVYASYVMLKDSAFIYGAPKKYAFSVRCIKNISAKESIHLDLSKGQTIIIPAETNVYAVMPKCGKSFVGNLSCNALDISYFKMQFGDIEYIREDYTDNGREILERYCGEENVLITATARIQCHIDQGW